MFAPSDGLHKKSPDNRIMGLILQPSLNACQEEIPDHGLVVSSVVPPTDRDALVVEAEEASEDSPVQSRILRSP